MPCGAAQCGAEPQRWWLRLRPSATATLRSPGTHPDWGMLSACPHLTRGGDVSAVPSSLTACWDQYTASTPLWDGASGSFQVAANRRAELLYSSDAASHTAALPTTVTPSCGTTPVASRYVASSHIHGCGTRGGDCAIADSCSVDCRCYSR